MVYTEFLFIEAFPVVYTEFLFIEAFPVVYTEFLFIEAFPVVYTEFLFIEAFPVVYTEFLFIEAFPVLIVYCSTISFLFRIKTGKVCLDQMIQDPRQILQNQNHWQKLMYKRKNPPAQPH